MKKLNIGDIKKKYRKDKTKPVGWSKQQLADLEELTSGEGRVAVSWILKNNVFPGKTVGLIRVALSNIRNGVLGWETK